ncbi:hypothetical protein M9458_036526 [Cirrhinus mrigala]|uniref:Uncharacterized protein n=1 Tax=Cirrhinus mrigala TaxID=683832 RepID=A0ABD0P2F2_CIRMR
MDPKYLREWRRLRSRVDASNSSFDGCPDLDVQSQGDVSGEGPSMQDVTGQGPARQEDVSGEGSSMQGHLFEEGLSSEVGAEEGPTTRDGSVAQDSDYGYKETVDSSESDTELESSDSDDTPSLRKDLAE